MPGRLRSTVSSVSCWEVSVRLAMTRLIGPAPKRRGEIETRSVEIEPVTTMRVGGRGSLRRSVVVPQAASASAAAIPAAAARLVAARISAVPPSAAPARAAGRSLLRGRLPRLAGDLPQALLQTVPRGALGLLVLAA